MPWKICFLLLPKPGKKGQQADLTKVQMCFDIPVLREPPGGPQWMTGGLDAKLIKDLPILATIDELAAGLSNASLRRTVQTTVREGVKQPELEDVTINFGKRA